MKKLIAPIFIVLHLLLSCSDIECPDFKTGEIVTLKDGRRVIIDTIIPGGFIVYVPSKMQIQPFQVSVSEIKR